MNESVTETRQLVSSKNPLVAIERIAYAGQAPKMKMYRGGYENYFDSLPILVENENLNENVYITQQVMVHLSEKLQTDKWDTPGFGEFQRTIIALEEPQQISDEHYREGAEIVVAQWGQGHTSPIHGHSTGYMHEEILSGRMLVNTYALVDENAKIVRLAETTIQERGVFVSGYAHHNPDAKWKRQTLIHNFKAIEPSVSLHYLPEHTRDGRDNTFVLQEFRQLTSIDVERISSKEGLYLQIGDVVLVRSTNVPEYGDHFLVVTGHSVMKKHGFRPQDRTIGAGKSHSQLLDENPLTMGLTLLKLKPEAQQEFLDFHGIRKSEDGKLIFAND